MNKQYKEKEKEYYSVVRSDLVDFIPGNLKKVLDVGCSNGNFGLMLKEQFKVEEVWGIEPFEESAIEASQKLNKVFHLPIESALESLEGNTFDCIFFNDVLEHLVDPYSTLSSVKKFINPSGYLFASIPNILQIETLYKIIKNREWKYESHGIMDKTHLRFFTKKSIIEMFNDAGYDIKLIEGINPKVKKKYKFLKLLLGKKAEDFKYVQFVVVSQKKSSDK